MSKPFDSTTKELLECDPGAWVELVLGRKPGPVRVLNVDLSTVTAEADSVLALDEDVPWLVHLELQSGYDPDLPLRLQRYNILVHYRHRLPVQSVALLLCREADGPALSGVVRQTLPNGGVYSEFRYNVVRAWECPVSQILSGGLGTLPLAPLGKLSEAELPAVIETIRERLDREATRSQADTLWTATYLLMGLRYPESLAEQLLQGVEHMKESVTYQKILREGLAEGLARGIAEGSAKGRAEGRTEGRAEEVRRILKRQAGKKFGGPNPRFEAAIDSIPDLDRLERLAERLLDAASWEELIGEPVNGAN